MQIVTFLMPTAAIHLGIRGFETDHIITGTHRLPLHEMREIGHIEIDDHTQAELTVDDSGEASAVRIGRQFVDVHAFRLVGFGRTDLIPWRDVGRGDVITRGCATARNDHLRTFGQQRPAKVAVVHPHERLLTERLVGHLILDRDRRLVVHGTDAAA